MNYIQTLEYINGHISSIFERYNSIHHSTILKCLVDTADNGLFKVAPLAAACFSIWAKKAISKHDQKAYRKMDQT